MSATPEATASFQQEALKLLSAANKRFPFCDQPRADEGFTEGGFIGHAVSYLEPDGQRVLRISATTPDVAVGSNGKYRKLEFRTSGGQTVVSFVGITPGQEDLRVSGQEAILPSLDFLNDLGL